MASAPREGFVKQLERTFGRKLDGKHTGRPKQAAGAAAWGQQLVACTPITSPHPITSPNYPASSMAVGDDVPFYRDLVYPKLVSVLGNPKPIQEVRQRILPLAQGHVLEIGLGPGVNFAYYDPGRVSRLYALEPNEAMIRIAEGHPRRAAFDVQFLDLPGERIPLADRTIDTVVSTFTLCTIPGIADAIRGIARVLKPSGRFIFFENSASPDPSVLRWQEWWAPVHHRIFSGLDITRDIPSAIEAGGFGFDRIEAGYLATFPRSWTHCCWGIAIPGKSGTGYGFPDVHGTRKFKHRITEPQIRTAVASGGLRDFEAVPWSLGQRGLGSLSADELFECLFLGYQRRHLVAWPF